MTVEGTNLEGKAAFTVRKPSATISVVSTGPVFVDNSIQNALLHCGLAGTNPGIKLRSNDVGEAGEYTWVQTTAITHRRQVPDGSWWNYESAGLDTMYPYGSSNETEDSPHLKSNAPQQGGEAIKLSAAQTCRMWRMYDPKTGDSIIVPLASLDWGWFGAAERDNVNVAFRLTAATPPNTGASSSPTNTHPEWNRVVPFDMTITQTQQ